MIHPMYRIISYTFNESSPTSYPISLDADEEIVFSREDVERICSGNDDGENYCEGKRPYLFHIQVLEIGDSGRFVLLDEEVRRCPLFGNNRRIDVDLHEEFRYGNVVEVLDDDCLTLGIIVHIPHQFYDSFEPTAIDKHLFYSFSVLLYKPDGRIVLEDVSPTHLLHSYTLDADSQIAALRTASENICVQE